MRSNKILPALFFLGLSVLLIRAQETANQKALDYFLIRDGNVYMLTDFLVEIRNDVWVLYVKPKEAISLIDSGTSDQTNNRFFHGEEMPNQSQVVTLPGFVTTPAGKKVSRFLITVREPQTIFPEPIVLDFKTARDNFGKLVGENFVVVQVNIRNQDPTKQFLLQNTEIILDSLRCNNTKAVNLIEQSAGNLQHKALQSEIESKKLELAQLNTQLEDLKKEKEKSKLRNEDQSQVAKEFEKQAKKFEKIKAEFAKLIKKVPNEDDLKDPNCVEDFEQFFYYPLNVSPVGRDVVLGSAMANQNRSRRALGFRALNFVSDLSSVFTGLNLFGRDGIKGSALFASTVIPGLEKAVPSIAESKMDNLKNALNESNIIIPNNSSKIVNIFIPAERVFYKETWKLFKESAKNSSKKSYRLHRLMEAVVTASVSGIKIPADAERVTTDNTGGAVLLRQ